MNHEVPIQAWSCTYYLNSERRWVSGRLSLTPTRLRFKEDNAETFLVSFHLSSISEIKKESSSCIFSSITVLEKDNVKHWFSSFQLKRSVIFTILEHFWRQLLLSPHGVQDDARTSKGMELINMASGSQKRLEETTKVLHHQGEQFDNMMRDLNKIEADVATADRMLSSLETPVWWPFSGNSWKRFSGTTSKDASTSARHKKEGVIATIPIIVSHRPDYTPKPGNLTVLVSGLEIADCNFCLLHRYERKDVDDIKVTTGHEVTIRQRFIGKPDITFRILSAKLPDVLPVLEMQYATKMQYTEEAAMFSDKLKSSPSDHCSPGWQTTDTWLLDAIVKTGPIASEQAEAVIQDQEVSQSEAQELRKILMKLKSIALDAECELERQDEALDEVTSSVDRSVFGIEKQTRRMRKLL